MTGFTARPEGGYTVYHERRPVGIVVNVEGQWYARPMGDATPASPFRTREGAATALLTALKTEVVTPSNRERKNR